MKNILRVKLWAKSMMDKILYDEKGEVNIVAIVIIIGIAVILALIFKEAISSLINTLLNQIQGNATNAIAVTP